MALCCVSENLPISAHVSYKTLPKEFHEAVVRLVSQLGTSRSQRRYDVIGIHLMRIEHRVFAVRDSQHFVPKFFSIFQLKNARNSKKYNLVHM